MNNNIKIKATIVKHRRGTSTIKIGDEVLQIKNKYIERWVSTDLHKRCKEIFLDERNKISPQYYWTGADSRDLNLIIDKIKFTLSEKKFADEDEIPDEEVSELFRAIITHMPDWYKNNGFDIKIINSKYNVIILQIANKLKNDKALKKQAPKKWHPTGA